MVTDFFGPPLESEAGIGSLTLGGLLTETAARHADREAIAFRPRLDERVAWTYAELLDESRAVARALLATGLQKGTRVGVLMGNRPEWVAAAFGIALAGGVIAPINTFFAPPELDYVLNHSDVALLIVQPRLLAHEYLDDLMTRVPGFSIAAPGELAAVAFPYLRRVVCIDLDRTVGAAEPWDAFLARGKEIDDAVASAAAGTVTPSDPALVVYTSGTTAFPKGIMHPHRAVALQSWRFAQQLRLDPTVRAWSAFPFFWSAGFVMIMGATLAAGGCLVMQDHFDPGEALALLEAERVTSAHAWPHQLAALEDHPDWLGADLSSIRQTEAFTSFGRHPTVHVEDDWSPRAAFGLSETCTIISSSYADTPREQREGHSGDILPGNIVRIIDRENGRALSTDEIGEITVKGPTLMSGYVKVDPAETFDVDGFFHTSDAGFVDRQNRLHWTGRLSDMIKTGGANVSPVEIETALLYHAGLKAAVAVGIPHETLGEMVVVCAVAHDGAIVEERDVQEFLRGRVASYKIPRRVVFVSESDLEQTANAKIRVDALRALVAERLA